MTTEEFKTNIQPELHEAAKQIREAAEAFNKLCTRIEIASEVPSDYMDQADTTQAPAAPEQEITLENIRAVLTEKTQDGLTAKIKALLQQFGAPKLSKVPKEKYPELMAAAKALK